MRCTVVKLCPWISEGVVDQIDRGACHVEGVILCVMKVTVGNVGRGLLQLYVCLAITHEGGLVNNELLC